MTAVGGGRVVVGVDDTDDSLVALDAAGTEAALRHRPLHVIHADPFATAADTATGLLSDAPGRLVTRAIGRARTSHPDLAVTGEVARGFPQPVLIEASRDAGLVVIGDRRLGALARVLVETVAGGLTAHASCPVSVIRGPGAPDGAIAVGVDGSPDSEAAVGFAFAEADLRGSRLVVVHVWSRPGPRKPGAHLPLDFDAESVRAGAERMMSEVTAGWREKYPGVSVTTMLMHGHPREVLAQLAETTSLIVVGARGRTASPVEPGAVSWHLLHHAPCPVVVVPAPPADASASSGS